MKRILAIAAPLVLLAVLSAAGADGPKIAADAPEDVDAPKTTSDVIWRLQVSNIWVREGGIPRGLAIDARTSPDARKALALLPRLPEATKLRLGIKDADDEDLQYVGRLTGLRELTLIGRGIKGPGMKYLRGLKRLQSLDARQTAIGDAVLADIAKMTSLENLLPPAHGNGAGPGGAEAAETPLADFITRWDRRRGRGNPLRLSRN